MLAIMGPSGSGKSTLLDCLSGRAAQNVTVEGELAVNGHAAHLAYGKAAYVAQDDLLMGTLTVRETLTYAARIRVPGLSSAQRKELVDDLLAELGMTKAADTFIGDWSLRGISGGQKRRVSIGVELVARPSILFLDEPTSGLDSAAAYFVMAAIRRLATRGKTVLTVIHQPPSEVFELFSTLLLLSEGRTVYFGAAGHAVELFRSAGLSPPPGQAHSDFFLHAINRCVRRPAAPPPRRPAPLHPQAASVPHALPSRAATLSASSTRATATTATLAARRGPP